MIYTCPVPDPARIWCQQVKFIFIAKEFQPFCDTVALENMTKVWKWHGELGCEIIKGTCSFRELQ